MSFAVRNITNAEGFEFVTDSTFFPGGYMAFQEFQAQRPARAHLISSRSP